jgi:hypothetical protein
MLISDVGSSTANSYISVVEADVFFNSSVANTAWPASETSKEASLIEATRILDSQFKWVGSIASVEQALRWPRKDAYDADDRELSVLAIPKLVKDATCNLAYFLLQNGGLNQTQSDLKGLKLGPIDLKFSEGQSVIGVPKYIVKSLQTVGQYEGYVEGSVYSVNAIRS